MDNTVEKEFYATLTIVSRTRSAEELMRLIPVSPDRSWQKGTPRAKNPSTPQGRDRWNVHRYSGLDFVSRLERSASPRVHIEDLLGRLSPVKDSLREFVEYARVEDSETVPLRVRLISESTSREIGVDFSNNLLKALSELGAYRGVELEFDGGL